MNKDRIYIVTSGFPYGTGEGPFILPEIEALKEQHDITIIACSDDHGYSNVSKHTKIDDKICIVRFNSNSFSIIEKVRYSLEALFAREVWEEISRIIKSRKGVLKKIVWSVYFWGQAKRFSRWVDRTVIIENDSVFYSFWYTYPVMGFQMVQKKYDNVKVITRVHGADLLLEQSPASWQPFKTYMDSRLDKILFIAKTGYDYYMQHWGRAGSDRYIVNRLGVKGYGLINPGSTDSVFRIVSCSYLVPIKRVELIIDGLSLINDIQISWIHFGDGELYDDLLHRAECMLGSKENIEYSFEGFRDNDEIMNYYSSEPVDCFITTSQTEGCPVSIQEAYAFGIPVIGTGVGAIPEMIDGNGILLPKDVSANDVSEAIIKMVGLDDDTRHSYKLRSFEIWKRYYNVNNNKSELMKIIDTL